jgi:hypothetical protein
LLISFDVWKTSDNAQLELTNLQNNEELRRKLSSVYQLFWIYVNSNTVTSKTGRKCFSFLHSLTPMNRDFSLKKQNKIQLRVWMGDEHLNAALCTATQTFTFNTKKLQL